MKSIDFPGCNAVYGKDQPEYSPLHAIKTSDGIATISCWELDGLDVQRIMDTKQIFVSLFTFGQPIQPHKLSTDLSDLVTFDKDAELVVPEEQREECEKARMPATLPDAIHKLRRILAIDQEYFATWQVMIAAHFEEENRKWHESQGIAYLDLHIGHTQKLAHEAAKNFLNALIKG